MAYWLMKSEPDDVGIQHLQAAAAAPLCVDRRA